MEMMFLSGIFMLIVLDSMFALHERKCEPFNMNITKESVYFVCDYEPEVNNTDASSNVQDGELVCKEENSAQDCAGWTFSGSKTSTDLTELKLNTFGQQPDFRDRVVLNVSLTNIRFTSFRYRIQRIGQPNITFCTEINIPADVNVSNLYFDCFWVATKEIGSEYQLEYEAQKGTLKEARTFLFKIHSRNKYESDIEDWYPFLYIDRTEFPVLIARWHQPPANLERKDYKLQVYDNDIELESVEVRSTHLNSSTDEELSYKYTCGMFPLYGYFRVKLKMVCNNCKVAVSPVIIIGNTARIILIASISGFLFIILMITFIFFVWKKRNQLYFDIKKLPKVLMLYSPSTQSHIRVMTVLAEYLRENCFVVALLDQLDIPRTETKDPFLWYNEAFLHADFIMVISSPPKCCNQGIFKNVDILALNFVTVLLSRRSRPHIFNVTLDYCGEDCIPKETMNFHSYHLTKDLDRMLWFIHNNGKFPTFIDVIYSFLGPKLFGGKSDLKTSRGRALLDTLKAAENPEINVCNCKNVNVVNNLNSAVYKIPEMKYHDESNLLIPNSNDAVSVELDKFFVNLENLNLSGDDDDDNNVMEPTNREPNLLNFLKL